MNEPERPPSLLDRLAEGVIAALGSFGFSATRLRWRWNRFRERMAQRRRDAENRMRGVTGRHRMCPACGALMPTGQRSCGRCGESLAGVPGPGPGRLLQWVVPAGMPQASALLLTANIAIFLLIALRAGFAPPEGGIFNLLSFSRETLFRYGAASVLPLLRTGSLVVFLVQDWWRLVAPTFLHHGLLHLFFNTYMLAQLGPLVEEELGRDRFFVLYTLCGTGGWIASVIVRLYVFGDIVEVAIGASGAILGLAGAALVIGIRRGGSYGQALRGAMTRLLLFMVVMSFLMPRMLDHYAHIGGLVTGAAFAALLDMRPTTSTRPSQGWRLAALACLAVVLAAILLAGWKGAIELDLHR